MKKVILNIVGAEELLKSVQKYLNVEVKYCATEKQCGNPPSGRVFKCINHTCKLEMLTQ